MYFKLFSNCIIVKGYILNSICDLQENKIYSISKNATEFIERCKIISVNDNLLNAKDNGAKYKKLLNHLTNNNMGHYFENIEEWPELELIYKTPEEINNSILELDGNNLNVIEKFLKFIILKGCKHIELRSYSDTPIEKIVQILNLCVNSKVKNVDMYVKFIDIKTTISLQEQIRGFKEVNSIVVHSVKEENLKNFEGLGLNNILLTKQVIKNSDSCGNVQKINFNPNVEMFSLSSNYNNCLFKKISLDSSGNIKSCPSMKTNFCNVNNLDFFKKYDKANKTLDDLTKKDDIEVCQNCEFRYVCTDCRAFTDSMKRKNARPSKCNYNPYIAKWEGEEGYRTLAECGVISNEHEFSIDHEKIALINKELWGDE